ncbi:MAG: single-stranded nucleic acid binding protein [Firmicutes bacterium]|nr:single-stranded nucleic acid binding protein [Bacillota bacterium]
MVVEPKSESDWGGWLKMKVIEVSGKTVEDALDAALAELVVSREEVEYVVLEEPSKGLFGFLGGRSAKLRVSVKAEVKEEEPELQKVVNVDPEIAAQDFLKNVFSAMKLKVSIERMTKSDSIVLNLRGDNLGVLIGKHGQTLDALQYLTNLAAHRDSENRIRITLDVEDYRKRREETLIRLAHRLADKVKIRGEKVVLEPMSPQERKIIHMALQNEQRVTTYSEGEEPFRKVVIALKK